jgi:hypothetical protein
VCGGPYPQRDCRRPVLFPFECLAGGQSVPRRYSDL